LNKIYTVFRPANKRELTQLRRSFDLWGIFEFMESQVVLMKVDRTNRSRHVLITTVPSKDTLNQPAVHPKHVGLEIGELHNKKFTPSLHGAEIIAKFGRNFPYILVNEIAEGLVLYGRDILGDSVLEVSKGLGQNEKVIILNQNRESIGLGQTRFSGEKIFRKGEVTVYTLLDLGMYLRDQDNR
jgi:60S ribosome subunit biogenesis protein NIP7